MEKMDSEKTVKIAVIMTCFNRKDYTVRAVNSLYNGTKKAKLVFVITDDASSDGTVKALEQLDAKIHIINGDGSLFWNGGMRKSMAYALMKADEFDYAFLINDDVDFFEGALDRMIERIDSENADVVVGATKGPDGVMTYGCQRKTSGFFASFAPIEPSKEAKLCDTFNCNAVLVRGSVFFRAGNLDPKYTHSLGDYDYGLRLRKMGFTVINTEDYVGQCSANDIKGSWLDPSLDRKTRLKKKESPKGLPRKDWFHFVFKNYNIVSAVYHFLTPYIKILIKK